MIFEEHILGDLSEIVAMGPFGSDMKKSFFVDSGIPIISGAHLTETKLNDRESYNFLTEEKANKHKRSLVTRGDVIFTAYGTIGQVCYIPEDSSFETYIVSQRQFFLRPKKDLLDYKYLTYFFKTNYGQHLLLANASQTGVPSISRPTSYLKGLRIKLPSLFHQQKISSFISTLDKKIELNQQMNETLEEIAKTLFKSWFIDFDPVRAKAEGRPTGLSKEISDLFPDSFEDSELGEIPKGWEIKKVKDLGKVICGKTPPTKDKENYGDGFNFLTIPDMHDQVFALESSKTITEKGSKTLKGKLLPTKTICVSCIATPGLTLIIDKPSYTNQQINSIIPNEDLLSYFLFLNFRTLGSKISIYGGGGSVFENMSKSKFEEILIKTPDEKILKYFEDYLCPIFEKIKINSKENKTLTRIRDTLLPKLISGELKIPDQGNLEEAGI